MNDTTTRPAIVEADNLTKVFRDFWRRPKVRAVNGITFEVRQGEVFGLLGPNGSGKSTTLKMILGLLYPTSGVLRVLGHSPREVKAKARVGYLPEESYLYPYLTAQETIDFYGKLFDLNGPERRQRTEQLLDMIGLRHARSRAVGEFSMGMARRVALAQALINDPDFIVLDEPTSGLDPIGCRQVKDLILTLARRGKTILLSSHLLADVEDVCDRVAILYNGRVQAMGSLNELLEERSRYRLTMPEVEPEVMKRILALVRAELNAEPQVDHPRRDLEQFFIEAVDKARKAATEASGVGPSAGVAEYLAKPEDVLRQLVAESKPAAPAAAEPPVPLSEEEQKAANERLRDLVEPPKEN